MIKEPGSGVYSIGAVARMLGVPAATLRTWEERYSNIMPERTPGGHRLYSREQVEQLRFVVVNVEQGMSPADAHRLLAAQLAEGVPGALTAPDGGVRLLVLLAEQDPFSAGFADYFLRTEGFETLAVPDAEEAQARLQERLPNLAIVDLLISGGEGYALCRALRERGNIPIVAVSTLELREEALECGADTFLQKPLDPVQLISTVKDILGTSAYLQVRGAPT